MSKEVQLYKPVSDLMVSTSTQEITTAASMIKRFFPKYTQEEAASLAIYSLMTGLSPMNNEVYYDKNMGAMMGIQGVRTKARQYNRLIHGADTDYQVEFVIPSPAEAVFDPDKGDIAWKCILTDDMSMGNWRKILKEWIGIYKDAGMSGKEAVAGALEVAGKKPQWTGVGVVAGRETFARDKVTEWQTVNGKNVPKTKEEGVEMWDRNERAQKRAEKNALKKRYPEMLIPDMRDVMDDQVDVIIRDVVTNLADKGRISVDQTLLEMGYENQDSVERNSQPDTRVVKEVIETSEKLKEVSDPAWTDQATRPWDALQVKAYIESRAKENEGKRAPTQKQIGMTAGLLNTTFGDKQYRYAVCKYLTGHASTKDIPGNYLRAIIDWLSVEKIEDDFVPIQHIAPEGVALKKHVMKEQGQQEMELEE